MTTFENTEGQRVFEDNGWYYPQSFNFESEQFEGYIGKDGFEVRFSQEAMAIDYLAGK